MEVWKEIEGYDFRYMVRDDGLIGRVQNHNKMPSGSPYIVLQSEKQRKGRRLAALVNEHFLKSDLEKDEYWIPIKGFEESHRISNKCNILRILASSEDKDGYLKTTVMKDKRPYSVRQHRVVLTVFNREPKVGEVCNHKDGNKQNNSLDNLEWVTCQRNTQHAFENELCWSKGEKHSLTKLTNEDVNEIRELYINGVGATDIAKKFSINKATVHRILKGQTWKYLKCDQNKISNLIKQNTNLKLLDKDVKKIRELYIDQGLSAAQLAYKFNVNVTTIYNIVRNKTRKIPD